MFLHFFLGFDIGFVLSVNNTFILEMIKDFYHIILTVPMTNVILWCHGRNASLSPGKSGVLIS